MHADVPSAAHVPASYRGYWIAWGVLLAITVAMLALDRPAVLLAGITVKAAIIAFWFMHLRHERWDFALAIVLAIFATGGVLFGLIAPDGMGA